MITIGTVSTGAFESAAEAAGVPLTVVRLIDEAALQTLGMPLLLVRPDGHVAWRGRTSPNDAPGVLAKVTGRRL